MDWNVDDRPPTTPGLEMKAWMVNDTVREVKASEWGGFYFTDCTNPMQNVFCAPDYIKGWVLKDARQMLINRRV